MGYYVSIGENIIRYLSYSSFAPIFAGRQLDGVTEIQFSSSMFGGYDTASITLDGRPEQLLMASDYAGRDIRIYDEVGVQVWEGFVNKSTAQSGAVSIGTGPVMDISNLVNLQYTEYTWSTNPPQGGGEKETGFFMATPLSDLSKDSWGNLWEIVTAPRPLSESEAASININLIDAKSQIQRYISADEGGDRGGVTLDCLGYFHLTKKLMSDYYSNLSLSGPEVIGYPMPAPFFNKIELAGTGAKTLTLYNEHMETSYDFIESGYQTISASTKYGVSFGVYNNRVVKYRLITKPTTPSVYVNGSTGKPSSSSVAHAPVYVQPGDWAQIVDLPSSVTNLDDAMFLVGRVESTNEKVSLTRVTFSAIDDALTDRRV